MKEAGIKGDQIDIVAIWGKVYFSPPRLRVIFSWSIKDHLRAQHEYRAKIYGGKDVFD